MTQERDIVDELREIERMNTTLHGTQMAARAADEIMQLRQQVTDLHGSAVDEGMCATPVETALWNALRIARSERDEARQRYCFAMAEHGEEAEARQNAKDEGWDCFKAKP